MVAVLDVVSVGMSQKLVLDPLLCERRSPSMFDPRHGLPDDEL